MKAESQIEGQDFSIRSRKSVSKVGFIGEAFEIKLQVRMIVRLFSLYLRLVQSVIKTVCFS